MNYRTIKTTVISTILLLFLPFISIAQDKVALIIGNNDYMGNLYNDLPTCINDAEEMNKCLTALGYKQIIVLKDANRQEILNAFKNLEKQLKNNTSEGVFYYSGHATYIDNNYCIIPAKTAIDQSSLKNDCIDTEQIKSLLRERCKYSFLFFDACRDGITTKDIFKSASDLQPTRDIKNTNQQFACYATEKGNVARAGTGCLSPFTKVLTSHLFDKETFAKLWTTKIEKEVQELANGQKPIIENTFNEDNVLFRFNSTGVKSIYDKNTSQSTSNNIVGITFNVTPKSKIKFGNTEYDSGEELVLNTNTTYKYTIEHPGYETYSESINVTEKTPSTININLTPLAKAKLTVICDKPQNAVIFLDGKYQGKSPLSISTTSGNHKITVSAERYIDQTSNIKLNPGDNKRYSFYLTKQRPTWLDFDTYNNDKHITNYHFNPKHQIGISYMYRPDDSRFCFGGMLASSTGFYRGYDWFTITAYSSVNIPTSVTVNTDIGNGVLVESTVTTSRVSNGMSNKYSSTIDPYNEATQYDANFLFVGNIGFNICNGIMIEAGLGGASHQKRYYMPDTYIVSKTTTTNNLTGELIGEPEYKYESTGRDKWYKDKVKWSPALRFGTKLFIPLDNYWNYAISIGGGYTYLPTNNKFSSWDVTVGFAWEF